jgi:hypothetical protein
MEKILDNLFLCAFVFWPLVVVASALLNMAVSAVFSWSELVLDTVAGILIGIFFHIGTDKTAGAGQHFLLAFSTGLPGILYWAKVHAFETRASLFLACAIWICGSTLLAALLDRAAVAIDKQMGVGGGLFSILPWACKFPFSLVTTSVGLLFFIVGIFRSFGANGRIGFLSGVAYVEWDTSSSTSSATTIGGTVQIWTGKFENLIEHELYHTRQCIYLHDWMIPMWLVGGVWGLISSAIDGNASFGCFKAARHDRELGNPIESAPYRISKYSNCP